MVRIQFIATNDSLRAAGETVTLFDYTMATDTDRIERVLITIPPQTLQMALEEYTAHFVNVTITPR